MIYFFTLLLSTVSFLCIAQDTSSSDLSDEEIPDENQLFNIDEKLQHNSLININEASAIDLIATTLVNQDQANEIILHRQRHGKFISLYELQAISSISKDTLKLLSQRLCIPFIDALNPRGLLKESTHYSLMRWERKTQSSKGYQEDSKGIKIYQGADYKLLYRFRSSFSNLYYMGISFEKDAGESLRWQPQRQTFYFDYASAYLILHPKKTIEQIAIGDFNFRNGHGLVFGGNFMQSKNPEYWSSSWQVGQGFRPHTSAAEYGFYRGIGIQLKKGCWSSGVFFSKTPQDGTIQPDQSISGMNTSGLHRSELEVDKKHNSSLIQSGGTINYKSRNERIHIGAEYLYSQFSHYLNPSINYYNQYSFRGKGHHIIGIDVQHHHAGGLLFSEFAYSTNRGFALYAGALQHLSKQTTWLFQAWSANSSFESLQGNIPSYSSNIGNETGIYQALLTQLSTRLKASTGFSVYRRTQASFRIKGPSHGHEWISRLTYQWKKNTIFFLQFRTIKQEETNDTNTIRPRHRYYLMSDIVEKENRHWELHTRVQWGIFDWSTHEQSYCMSQSIGYRYQYVHLKAQLSLFDSPSWESRLYVYEPDVPMAFSIPALAGNGIRMGLVCTIKVFSKSDISCKISHTTYTHAQKIGSGYDEVEGNEQTEIRVQARIFL